jgi:dynein cytoplasmic 1 light intermediate chain
MYIRFYRFVVAALQERVGRPRRRRTLTIAVAGSPRTLGHCQRNASTGQSICIVHNCPKLSVLQLNDFFSDFVRTIEKKVTVQKKKEKKKKGFFRFFFFAVRKKNRVVCGEMWRQLLSEVSSKNAKVDDSLNIVMLGDRGSGRSTLVDSIGKLNRGGASDVSSSDGKKSSQPCLALDYSYLDVRLDESAHDEDTVARVNVWEMTDERYLQNQEKEKGKEKEKEDGAGASTASQNLDLFDLILPCEADSLQRTLVVITLDFAKPWSFGESLAHWMQVVCAHVDRVRRLSPTDFAKLQQSYEHFVRLQSAEPASLSALVAKYKRHLSQQQQQNQEDGSGAASSAENEDNNDGDDDEGGNDVEALLPTLGDGVLDRNLGVPIVVVACKVDMIDVLRQDYGFKGDMFDYINQYLRRTCLEFGASLVYASARDSASCSELWQYLQCALHRRPFALLPPKEPQVQEKESGDSGKASSSNDADDDRFGETIKEHVFLPAGRDSAERIQQVFVQQTLSADPSEPFNDVVSRPSYLRDRVAEALRDRKVARAETAQEFLARHLEQIQSGSDADSSSSSSSSSSSFSSDLPLTPVKPASSPATDSPAKPIATSTPTKSAPASDTDEPTTPGVPDSERQVALAFFNSLLE